MLMNDKAEFELAVRLRTVGAPLGEVFSFLSGLYFRGKLAYSQHFGRPSLGTERAYVITSDTGLVTPDETISLERLKEFSQVSIDPHEPRYREPLMRSATTLNQALPLDSQIVLLGSLATEKYTSVFSECFGNRLAVPREFVGRGDMSRGGLMLRCVTAGEELRYLPVAGAIRHGQRPPKLQPLPRAR
jgi:hypothetical protein